MFNNICIIGCGLIGSSILRAIKTKKISKKVTICDKSRDVLSYLKKENLAEIITDNPKEAVKDSDLIIISTPLSSYKEILLIIKDNLKNDTILTDTGSVKKEINKVVENLNLKNISWIASHPIAGTEESGPQSGYAELFNNRWCIISASNNAKKEHIDKLKHFWEKLGSKVKQMKVDEHDHILSLTSHLPHAVAYNLVKTAVEDNAKFKNEIIKYSAGGLRDFTRIAASDPVMWRDIFIDNSKDVLDVLNKFSENIQDFKKALSEKNGDKLLKIFLSTKNIRKEIIKAGQDVESPDFGRKKN